MFPSPPAPLPQTGEGRAHFGVLVLAAVAALSACAQKIRGDALYEKDECRRVAIIDAGTAAPVVGAEDLAFDPASQRIFISAYDRRAVERAIQKNAPMLPQGGVYAATLSDLTDAQSLTLPSIVARGEVAGGLRPHGLAFDSARGEIIFINRSYEKADGRWRMTARLERARADGGLTSTDETHCAANDLAPAGAELFISFDHASCGRRAAFEDAVAAKSGGIVDANGDALLDGVRFANGLAAVSPDQIALAATRDRKVLMLKEEADALHLVKSIPVPGAPDNLNATSDGKIIAALHSSLLAVARARRLSGTSGSRIVRIDPESGDVTLLFDDPKGELFSAATAAIEEDGVLIAGSVVDAGLLVCKSARE